MTDRAMPSMWRFVGRSPRAAASATASIAADCACATS
jgi:hypothetical protein